jgi:hypothetical protein
LRISPWLSLGGFFKLIAMSISGLRIKILKNSPLSTKFSKKLLLYTIALSRNL